MAPVARALQLAGSNVPSTNHQVKNNGGNDSECTNVVAIDVAIFTVLTKTLLKKATHSGKHQHQAKIKNDCLQGALYILKPNHRHY